MPYAPGTKLSYSNGRQCATVLTEGDAMVTVADGVEWREKMRLADWLILADGQRVEEEFIPVPRQQDVVYPVATRLTWYVADNNYSVAIVTSRGILTVKSVYPGITPGARIVDTPDTLFNDFETWVNSMPSSGVIRAD